MSGSTTLALLTRTTRDGQNSDNVLRMCVAQEALKEAHEIQKKRALRQEAVESEHAQVFKRAMAWNTGF